jgi:2-polyprenyl-3-methyl-5-hydroxy-6-metoxy-1,4-benzoquinol methylase
MWVRKMTDLSNLTEELKKYELNIAQQIVTIITKQIKDSLDQSFLRLSKEIQDIKLLLTHSHLVQGPFFKVITDHQIAIDSWDHKQPRGTVNDDTRCFAFVKRTEDYFGRKVRFCDLGCAGGGLVYDFLTNNNIAIGIDGSDISKRMGRAHWRVIPDCLMVADLTKPYSIVSRNNDNLDIERFDIMSAWEVMEHIPENLLPAMLHNVYRHLSDAGIFVGSVSTCPDQDPVTGAVWHQTIKPKQWWMSTFSQNGFTPVEGHPYLISDFPRGSGNPYAEDWDARKNPHLGFHFVLSKS